MTRKTKSTILYRHSPFVQQVIVNKTIPIIASASVVENIFANELCGNLNIGAVAAPAAVVVSFSVFCFLFSLYNRWVSRPQFQQQQQRLQGKTGMKWN
jgi:hypothetical protein